VIGGIGILIALILLIVSEIQLKNKKAEIERLSEANKIVQSVNGYDWLNSTDKYKQRFIQDGLFQIYKDNEIKIDEAYWRRIIDSCYNTSDTSILAMPLNDLIRKYKYDSFNKKPIVDKENENNIADEIILLEEYTDIRGSDDGYKWNKTLYAAKIDLCNDIADRIGRNNGQFYYDCIEETYNTKDDYILRQRISTIAGLCTGFGE
jgi:hypothetical protein